jgi:hypothetical protein
MLALQATDGVVRSSLPLTGARASEPHGRSDATTQDQHNRDDDQDEDDSSETDVHEETFPAKPSSITSTSTHEPADMSPVRHRRCT